MAALFISDLHLTPERAAPNQQLLAFLTQQTASGDALYILGDLFEYWVGDDDLEAPLHRIVVNALHATASRGVGLFFIAGNRDFLVGPAFLEAAQVTLLPDGTSFDLHGQRTVLLHGDTLCTDDKAYQQFRTKVRAAPWQQEFLARPLAARLQEVEHLRRLSEVEKASKAAMLMDTNAKAVENLFRDSAATRMVHGHTHRPARHDYLMFDRSCTRWVLPAWDQRAGYLRIDAQGEQLHYL